MSLIHSGHWGLLSVLLPLVQDAHGNSLNICSLASRGDMKISAPPAPRESKLNSEVPSPHPPQAHSFHLLLLRGHRGQVSSLEHAELLSLMPRLLDTRKVIQALAVDLPALQDQLEKLIWSKGWGGERTRGWLWMSGSWPS